jgi:beta-glucoside kinase
LKKYISFDIGGTKVKHGLLLENGSILSKGNYDTHCTNLESFLKDIVDTINMYKKNHHIRGVGISLPGYINPATGYSELAGSVTALNNKNLKSLLEKKVSLRVEIENDGNCAALAEKISGNGKKCSDFICILLGTGIGGGIFINGKLLHGHSFRGGEFGYMITQAGREQCDIWHCNASTAALIHSYKKLKGISDSKNIKGETIFLEAVTDPSIKRLIDDWARNISYGIFNLAATLNPEKILIGGGVSSQQGLLSTIKNKLNQIHWWKDIQVPVERCKYQNDAGMIGALYHLLQKLNTE